MSTVNVDLSSRARIRTEKSCQEMENDWNYKLITRFIFVYMTARLPALIAIYR